MPEENQIEELKKLLQENIEATKEVQQMAQRTVRYIKWLRIMDTLKLLLIIIPIIAAWLYLPQLFDLFSTGYGGLIPGLGR